MACVSLLTVQSRGHIECGVVGGRRLILRSIGALIVILSVCMSFNDRSKEALTNAPNPRRWWPTVKTAVFSVSSSLPPLLDRGGRLVWSADEKTPLFSAHFDAKQFRSSFQQPYSCARCQILRSVGFHSSFVCSLSLNLDPFGGNDPDRMFPFFTSKWHGN